MQDPDIEKAWSARRAGNAAEARRLLEAAVARARGNDGSAEDRAGLALALCKLAHVRRDAGETQAADDCYAEATAIYRDLSDGAGLAYALRNHADLARAEGDAATARQRYEESAALYRATAPVDTQGLANALRGRALVEQQLGDTQAAERFWAEARELYARVGVQMGDVIE